MVYCITEIQDKLKCAIGYQHVWLLNNLCGVRPQYINILDLPVQIFRFDLLQFHVSAEKEMAFVNIGRFLQLILEIKIQYFELL